jgi:hypothetical protein
MKSLLVKTGYLSLLGDVNSTSQPTPTVDYSKQKTSNMVNQRNKTEFSGGERWRNVREHSQMAYSVLSGEHRR